MASHHHPLDCPLRYSFRSSHGTTLYSLFLYGRFLPKMTVNILCPVRGVQYLLQCFEYLQTSSRGPGPNHVWTCIDLPTYPYLHKFLTRCPTNTRYHQKFLSSIGRQTEPVFLRGTVLVCPSPSWDVCDYSKYEPSYFTACLRKIKAFVNL